MVMKARLIANIIEEFAPLHTQLEWDNAGFCIGSPDAEIKGVLVGFDCTPDLLREAIEVGANMVVTHHPLIFNGVKKINDRDFIGETICLAVKNDIVVYAAHTNADKAAGGVNTLMARRLSLSHPEPLDETGLCLVGDLSQTMSSAQFIDYVKKCYSLVCLRTSKPLDKGIRKVAVSSGSGSSFISAARAAGADAIITGDVSYHHFFCDDDFMVLDIGHYESEIDIVSTLLDILQKKLPNFAVSMTIKNNNPIYYR